MIELSKVTKRYSSTDVLRNVDLTVEEGEFAVIRGKSGTGKTTLLKIIGLLETPDDGKIKLMSRDVDDLSDNERSDLRLHHVGFIFQFFNLIPSLRIIENIELPLALAGISGKERKNRAWDLLTYFGLRNLADRFPETLSGGERQRIAILRALANDPDIILADEPTSSLDDENSNLLLSFLTEINKERKVTIIITTTDLYGAIPSTTNYILKEGTLATL